jgi:hypothetical protein
MMKNLFKRYCKHQMPTGWCGGLPYFRTSFAGVDGMGIEHLRISYKCGKCTEEVVIGMIHVPVSEREKGLERCLEAARKEIEKLREELK